MRVYSGLKRAFLGLLYLQFEKMSSRGKRKDDDVRASDDESETHAPAKKVAKPADSSDESDDIVVCNVSLFYPSLIFQ